MCSIGEPSASPEEAASAFVVVSFLGAVRSRVRRGEGTLVVHSGGFGGALAQEHRAFRSAPGVPSHVLSMREVFTSAGTCTADALGPIEGPSPPSPLGGAGSQGMSPRTFAG
jgi:hypothetical protein